MIVRAEDRIAATLLEVLAERAAEDDLIEWSVTIQMAEADCEDDPEVTHCYTAVSLYLTLQANDSVRSVIHSIIPIEEMSVPDDIRAIVNDRWDRLTVNLMDHLLECEAEETTD